MLKEWIDVAIIKTTEVIKANKSKLKPVDFVDYLEKKQRHIESIKNHVSTKRYTDSSNSIEYPDWI
jgi:hypothetical protein